MSTTIRLAGLAFATALLAPDAGEAQAPRTLSSPTEFPEPFSNIVAIRERSDGSLLVSDRSEKALYRVDFGRGTYDKIGGNGAGPQEYETVGALYPLAGDTTLLVDVGNFRLALLDPASKIVATTPLMMDNTLRMPRGSDARGNLYWDQARQVSSQSGIEPLEGGTAPIIRWRFGSNAMDTVAMIARSGRAAVSTWRMSGGSASAVTPTKRPAYSAQDAWVVAADGRIAVVHHEDYHVEWIPPNGTRLSGNPIPYQPVNVGRAEKEAWIDAQGDRTMTMRIAGQGTRTFTTPKPKMEEVDFPDVLPAFNPQAVYVAPEGDIWVRRYEAASAPGELYDVIDAKGALREQVRLPKGHRLLGLGHGVLYAYHADEDDLKWLERYPR